jgi:asparagine synthase (glutamine-hydrolysing)
MRIPHNYTYKTGHMLAVCKKKIDFLLWLSTTWKPEEVNKLLLLKQKHVIETNFLKIFNELKKANLTEKMMAIDVKTFLKDDILVKVDRASMANSLEVRSPLLDYRLVELAFQIPFDYKIHYLNPKYILKDLLRHYIPPKLFENKKIGFNIPLSKWLKNELREYVEEFLSEEKVKQRGIIDWAYLKKIKNAFYNKNIDFSRKLFNLLILENWFQYYDM